MISISELTEAHYNAWDAYVNSHPLASPYQRSAWKAAVESAYNFACCYLVAREEGTIIGVLPLIHIKPPLMQGTLCALPFCDVGGPLANSEAIANQLINHALGLAKQQKIKRLEIRQSSESKLEAITPSNTPAPKVRMLLPLYSDPDELFASFKSKLRSQIRKAQKNGLEFTQGTDLNAIDAFYSVYAKNMHRLGSPAHSRNWFYKLFEYYGDNIAVGTVYLDGDVAGGGIVLFNGNQACIPWASTLSEFNKLAPNMLLYWSLLKLACERGCKQFDFGRSTFGEGTYKFKSQWGAEPELLNWTTLLSSTGMVMRNENKAEKSSSLRPHIEKLWSQLPASVVARLGPALRKYITL